MKKTIALVLVLALAMTATIANADFTFGEPTNLGLPMNSSASDTLDFFSADGLEMYLTSDRSGGYGSWDIWVSRRPTTDDEWGIPKNLGPTINTNQPDFLAYMSSDNLELYFTSYKRSGGYGLDDIWVSRRTTRNDPWGTPVNLGPNVNSSANDGTPSISPDGLELYFVRRSGGYGSDDIWVSRRATKNDPWGEPENLGSVVNSSASEAFPFLFFDGLTLFFSEEKNVSLRPGGFGNADMWFTVRDSLNDPWGAPVNLGAIVNSLSLDCNPRISPDGSTLYFTSERPGGFGGMYGDIYEAPIIPIVDLNSDGIVDGADLSIIADYWGTDNSLCDIGPMPWGDGVVDVQDLIVIAEYLSPAGPEVHVNEADNGGQIELEQSQILVVTLESNPTTGYSWQQAENQEPFLEQMGESEFIPPDEGEPPIVGAGGWEIFRFKAISAGNMTLQLVYRRPWEEGVEPVKTFTLDLAIH
ncbi:MAG: protease inhibitor I42 family protein [Planctomycetota bacterium]|jgi:predicted secreted protein